MVHCPLVYRRSPQLLELRKATLEIPGYPVQIATSGHTSLKIFGRSRHIGPDANSFASLKCLVSRDAGQLHILRDCHLSFDCLRSGSLRYTFTSQASGNARQRIR